MNLVLEKTVVKAAAKSVIRLNQLSDIEPMQSKYADLLNALDAMGHNPLYAMRRDVIRGAESAIVQLEKLNASIICAFCAKEYPKGESIQETAERLAAHIWECEKHPMRAAVISNGQLKAVLAMMWAWQKHCQELPSDELGEAVKELIGEGLAASHCACGKPATCYGAYEGKTGFACDDCCGHGCEDGKCISVVPF